MGIAELTQGKKFKNFMAKLYGFGAAIVIVGALFKIQHWPASGFFLVLGLGTEAVIFFFSAFEPPHEEVDWSLVYPELAGMGDEESSHKKEKKRKPSTDPIAQKLDALMEDAKIGPELIESLGRGLSALGDNASKLSDMSNASVATDEYVKSLNKASNSAGAMSDSYNKAAAAAQGMNEVMANFNASIESSVSNMKASVEDTARYRNEV
ncbi:MAG: gliding motility protein GldL, partial [Bacteroidota bacterium]